jgi:hypothetical protein
MLDHKRSVRREQRLRREPLQTGLIKVLPFVGRIDKRNIEGYPGRRAGIERFSDRNRRRLRRD